MAEYRFITLTRPTSELFSPVVGAAKSNTVDFLSSVPELAEHMDGWDVINTQLLPNGEVTFIVFTLRTEVGGGLTN